MKNGSKGRCVTVTPPGNDRLLIHDKSRTEADRYPESGTGANEFAGGFFRSFWQVAEAGRGTKAEGQMKIALSLGLGARVLSRGR